MVWATLFERENIDEQNLKENSDFDGKKTLLYKAKKDKILKNYKTLDVRPKVLTTDFMNIQQKVVDNLYYFLSKKNYHLCSVNEGLKTLKI